jgi:hypothetical protein
MSGVDLASEMAAARERRDRQTVELLREARVQAIRGAVRPGSTRVEVEERARSFYPRLNEHLLQEAVALVCGEPPPAPPVAGEPVGAVVGEPIGADADEPIEAEGEEPIEAEVEADVEAMTEEEPAAG